MSRGNAVVRVGCDRRGCQEYEEVELTALAMRRCWDERNVDGALRRQGWTKEGEQDVCPGCSDEKEDPS